MFVVKHFLFVFVVLIEFLSNGQWAILAIRSSVQGLEDYPDIF